MAVVSLVISLRAGRCDGNFYRREDLVNTLGAQVLGMSEDVAAFAHPRHIC